MKRNAPRVKRYLVSVDVYFRAAQGARVNRILSDHLVKVGVHSLDLPRVLIHSAKLSRMSIVSPLSPLRGLEGHLTCLLSQYEWPKLQRELYEASMTGTRAVLSIGVTYRNSITCTVALPASVIELAAKLNLPLTIACYPSR